MNIRGCLRECSKAQPVYLLTCAVTICDVLSGGGEVQSGRSSSFCGGGESQ